MSIARELWHFWRWWAFPHRHQIPQDAIVVDIGCGNWPNMRANILVDKFLDDDSERPHPLRLDHRPFIVCDCLYLPFKNRTVDFIVCSHLAEHVEQPEALFAELTRVAKSGYVECPSRIREILHGWEFHRWYVEVRGDRLIFEEKPQALHDPELHRWFSHLFETDCEFERFFVDHMERLGLVAGYRWRDEIKYTVHRLAKATWQRVAAQLDTRGPITSTELAVQLRRSPSASLTRNERIKQRLAAIARWSSDRHVTQRLRHMLCCPICKRELADGVQELACVHCEAKFPIVGNVYYLVPEQAATWQSHPTVRCERV